MSERPKISQLPGEPPKPRSSASSTLNGAAAVNSGKPRPNNVVAGVKRRSEEPESEPSTKNARFGQQAAPTSNRFQLSGRPGVQQSSRPSLSAGLVSSSQTSLSRPGSKASAATGLNASGPAPKPQQKRGFASIMERAKAAQEAAESAGPSGIKHKAAEKVSKRDRLKAAEEVKAQQRDQQQRSRPQGTVAQSTASVVAPMKGSETAHKTSVKRTPQPLAYKGTMRPAAPGQRKDARPKVQAQDKYGGYASWSDVDDAEDEDEEDGYDSDGSSDMEAGFDDVVREDSLAARAARREDDEAAKEEERLRKEKLERKRKLLDLSKSAAARKRY